MVKILLAIVLALVLCAPGAQPAHAHGLQRTKPGPVTIRGVALNLTSRTFVLRSSTKGTFRILLSPATAVTEKGISGRAVLHNNDHVGVRGFLHGRDLTAITVRIYPTKAKAYDIRGTVVSRSGSLLVVRAGSHTSQIVLTSQTVVHIGSALGSSSEIVTGDQILVRVQPGSKGLLAVHIHIYRHKAAGQHIEFRGRVQSVVPGSVRVSTGNASILVRVTSATKVYLGTALTSSRSLKMGQTVRVYACCVGSALNATSIHIEKSASRVVTALLRGSVVAISGTRLTIAGGSGTVSVALDPTTVYQVGSKRVGWSGVHVGDQVSVRAYRQSATWHARSVHVLASSRRMTTVTGTVQSVGLHSIVVLAEGKRYSVTISAGTTVTLNGARGTPSEARKGDRVRVVGHVQGATISATQVTLRRIAVRQKITVLHGVISRVAGAVIIVTDSGGTQYQVKLGPGVSALLHGTPAPLALFPGVHVVARGNVSGKLLTATRLTVTVTEKTITGRLLHISRWSVEVGSHSGQDLTLDLVQGTVVVDGQKHESGVNLHVGAYVQARGYQEQSNRLRGISVQVQHPTLALAGVISAAGQRTTIQTSRGETYVLRFGSQSRVSSGTSNLTVTPSDIVAGARVHVAGKMQSDGTLLVSTLDVHLSVETVRGTVTSLANDQLTLQVGIGSTKVRLSVSTFVAQGSRTLSASDIVVGDDITAHGYLLGSTLAASKISVHRKLVALDGSVSSLTADGFTLAAADGNHRVIVSSETVYTGGATASFVSGSPLHVTGYRRGDGVILATRIRPGKKIRPFRQAACWAFRDRLDFQHQD